ncbi:MAG: hypothetical protein ACYTGB_03400 [Planctomycetota bacterium]|jgi:hypothetical protein
MSAPGVYTVKDGVWVLEKPEPGFDWKGFLRLHNPFYLASAACMLLGCYLLTGTFGYWGAEKVAALVAVLNVYELLVVGLACYLIGRRRAVRDGRMLLLIEVLLLVDGTNLLAESWTCRRNFGLYANASALILAGIKIGTVVWLLRLRYRPRELAAAALGYLAMLAMPGLLAYYNRMGADMERPLHAAWWAAGALAVIISVLASRGKHEMRPLERALGRAALVAPWVSMVVHLFLSHWVHEAEFRICNLAPVVLGLAAVALHRRPKWLTNARARYLLAGTAAVCPLLTVGSADWLTFDAFGVRGLLYSPMRAVLLSLSGLFFWAAFTGRGWLHSVPASAFLTAAASGHSPAAIVTTWKAMASSLMPRSQSQWGIISVIAAFLLLGAGAAVSVYKGRAEEGAETGGTSP